MTDDVANDLSQAPSSPALNKYFDYTFTRFVRIIEVSSSFSVLWDIRYSFRSGPHHTFSMHLLHMAWEEGKKGGYVCVLSSSFLFYFFYTLCDSWSSAWSKFNILTIAAFNEGPLVCILSLWVIVVMQNIRARPSLPVVDRSFCSYGLLLQMDQIVISTAQKSKGRGQRRGVWVRNNWPRYERVIHSTVNQDGKSWLIGQMSWQLVWAWSPLPAQQNSLLCFYGEVAEQRKSPESHVNMDGFSWHRIDTGEKKQRQATNWAEAPTYMWTINGVILIMLR